jgi:hypothetical protein
MADKPSTDHGTVHKPPRKRRGQYIPQTRAAFDAETDKALAQAAYDRANAWALSPAGTPYGSTTVARSKP